MIQAWAARGRAVPGAADGDPNGSVGGYGSAHAAPPRHQTGLRARLRRTRSRCQRTRVSGPGRRESQTGPGRTRLAAARLADGLRAAAVLAAGSRQEMVAHVSCARAMIGLRRSSLIRTVSKRVRWSLVGGPGFEPGPHGPEPCNGPLRPSLPVTNWPRLNSQDGASLPVGPPPPSPVPGNLLSVCSQRATTPPTTTRFVLARVRRGRPVKSRPPLAPTAARSLAAPAGAGCPSTSTLGSKVSGRPSVYRSPSSNRPSPDSPPPRPAALLCCQRCYLRFR